MRLVQMRSSSTLIRRNRKHDKLARTRQCKSQTITLAEQQEHGHHKTHTHSHEKENKGAGKHMSRRETMISTGNAIVVSSSVAGNASAAKTPQVQVGEDESITDALLRAPTGSILRIPAKSYSERLLINKDVTIRGTKKGTQLSWSAGRPCISVRAGAKVRIRDVTLKHSDAKYEQNGSAAAVDVGCSLEMEGCELSSSTGSGARSNGGNLTLRECRLVSSSGDGASFTDGATGRLEGCLVQNNGGNGASITLDAYPDVRANTLANNAGYGLDCDNCGRLQIRENSVYENKKGSFRFANGAGERVLITSDNSLDTEWIVES